MKNKILGIMIILGISFILTICVDLNTAHNIKGLFLKNVEALADGEGSSGNYSKGYINNPQPCTVTETVQCSFSIPVKWLEWCKIHFSYTVDHAGTQNYCTYTGGNSGCSYHTCIKNG